MNVFSNIIPCPLVNGSFTYNFCCSEKPGSVAAAAGCCDRAFDLRAYPVLAGSSRDEANVTSTISPSQSTTLSKTASDSTAVGSVHMLSSVPASSTSASSTSASNPPAEATLSTQQSKPLRRNVEIGVAIGVSLGVSLILGLIVFLIHEHRLRIKAQKEVIDTLATEMSPAAMTSTESRAVRDQLRLQELAHVQPQPGELYDGQIHEADVRT